MAEQHISVEYVLRGGRLVTASARVSESSGAELRTVRVVTIPWKLEYGLPALRRLLRAGRHATAEVAHG